jgi:hypothetical protein
VEIPEPPPEHWLIESTIDLQIGDDSLCAATVVLRWNGEAADRRMREVRQKDAERFAHEEREWLQRAFWGAVIESLDEGRTEDGAWELRAQLRGARLLDGEGELKLLHLPWLYGGQDPPLIQRWRNLLPLQLQGSWSRSTVRVVLPAGASVALTAPDWEEQREHWSGRTSSSLDGGVLRVFFEGREERGSMDRNLADARIKFQVRLSAHSSEPVVLRFSEEP